MMIRTENYPSKALADAVEAISSLPGVGSRSALRLALHLLHQPADRIHRFASAIDNLAEGVHYCRTCMMVADGDQCGICSDAHRDHSTICVVESVRDVMSIEATGQYNGVYHVLGASSPLSPASARQTLPSKNSSPAQAQPKSSSSPCPETWRERRRHSTSTARWNAAAAPSPLSPAVWVSETTLNTQIP